MQRIAIVGLGHVGASLGLALKRWIAAPDAAGTERARIEIVGFDHDPETQRAAEKRGAVDRARWSLGRAVGEAALVVVALPAHEEREALRELASLLPEGCIVTDTGAHKARSLAWASELLPAHAPFVAGHPVLPTPEDPLAASADAFAGRTWALFPHDEADPAATEVVVGLVQAAGARPYFPDPAEHDAQTALSSTLPALLAAALMHAAGRTGAQRDLRAMAGSDLEAATRLAALPPETLAGMAALSPRETARWLDTLIADLGALRDLAAAQDGQTGDALLRYAADAKAAREQWLRPDARENAAPRDASASQLGRFLFGGGRRRRG